MQSYLERAGAGAVGRRAELPAAQAAARAIAAQDAQGIAHFIRGVAVPLEPLIDRLPSIEAPALLLVGADDTPFLRASQVMEARLPHAERCVLADAGHIANIERSAAFNAAVAGFLAKLSAQPPAREPDTGSPLGGGATEVGPAG